LDLDSEASSSSVGPPAEALEETEPERGHVRNRFACPSPNRKRPRTRLAASEQMSSRTNPRDCAIGSRSSVENGAGHDEKEDSKPSPKPSPVTSNSALVASYPDQKVVQEDTHYEIPSGWKHGHLSHFRSFSAFNLCVRIRKCSVLVFQTKHY
jgi:hypothetical protein